MAEDIWYRDWRGFWRKDALVRTLPERGTPLVQQLNALFRLSLYYGAAVFLLRPSAPGVLLVPALVAALTYLVHEGAHGGPGGPGEARGAQQEGMHVGGGGVGVDPRTGAPCTVPTRDNPFMNVLVSDYALDPGRPAACAVEEPEVRARAEREFDHNLYRDSKDVFRRVTSSRAFYTTAATTIPNDQAGFAEWLYRVPGKTCKEGGAACARLSHRHPRGTG